MPVRRQEYPWSWILLSPWKGSELLDTDKSRLKWRVFSLIVCFNLAWKWILNFEFWIQNYNKSRIHSFRGVQCIDMTLDGSLIFQGEIARYCVLFVCVRQLFVCFTVKACLGLSISCNKREKQNTSCASCGTFLFLPHFDIICDLLLNRRTATWNLLVQ